MRLREHIIIGGVAAAALVPVWGFYDSLLFWIAAVLIDADHYLDYLYRTKGRDWSPSRMFRYYDEMTAQQKNTPEMLGFSLFHTIEIFLLLYVCALYINFNFFIVVLAGMLFHMILDMIWLNYHKVFFIRSYSLIEHKIRRHRLLKKGLNPQNFFDHLFEITAKK